MTVRTSFFKRSIVVVIALVIATLGVALSVPVAGAAQEGFPIYSWGGSQFGMLGRNFSTSPGSPIFFARPAQVLNENNVPRHDFVSATNSNGSWAVSTSGHLYAWGDRWYRAGMGQNGVQPPAAFLSPTGDIIRPMRVGTANNWVQVSADGRNVVVLNSNGHIYYFGENMYAPWNPFPNTYTPTRVQGGPSNFVQVAGGSTIIARTSTGEIWVAGSNHNAVLANGTVGGSSTTLVKVQNTADNWVHVAGSLNHAFAINANGQLFSWGRNHRGTTGRGVIAGHTTTPTQIGTASNWADVRHLVYGGVALNSNGQIFTWGGNEAGVLGQGIVGSHLDVLTPTQVGTANNWVAIYAGHSRVHAINDAYELWGWGLNSGGQIGDGAVGSANNRNSPVFVIQTYGYVRGSLAGNLHSLMLIRTTSVESSMNLTKALQKPEGTPIPNPGVTFTFNVTPHSYNNNTAQSGLVPTIPLANRSVIINNTGTTTGPTGGVLTTTNSTDLLEDISFTQIGRFAWRVTEVQTATGVGPNSEITVFSQAEYEIAVYVQIHPTQMGQLQIAATTIYRVRNAQGTLINPPIKVDNLRFDNIYRRTTTGTQACPGALLVSKTVTGVNPPANASFDFHVTLTRTVLCPPTTTFTGRVFNAANAQVGPNITFTSGTTQTVTLAHDQRLVIERMVIGSSFLVVEPPVAGFDPSVVLHVNGVLITPAPTPGAGGELSTGTHVVGADLRNSAAFTNDHRLPPPTGLNIDNQTTLLLPVVAIMIVSLLVLKARKRIEDLSIYTQ